MTGRQAPRARAAGRTLPVRAARKASGAVMKAKWPASGIRTRVFFRRFDHLEIADRRLGGGDDIALPLDQETGGAEPPRSDRKIGGDLIGDQMFTAEKLAVIQILCVLGDIAPAAPDSHRAMIESSPDPTAPSRT